eukprot:CAMPEP_0202054676 /NCGR_PEP_ID=MMETSP0963-20130614/9118_1 /ASSEMBLY_ACC=CAM_ASM_000494 /TAXON_ID=4773 /ORGANISM="Schizochytrium aggregatum, Strain ATCC28209" /LENGTH=212 /DNA_ID=CAMNT_0048620149 /DNA_START=17 /DNA_END=652 /DNA_ORIENTATION=-
MFNARSSRPLCRDRFDKDISGTIEVTIQSHSTGWATEGLAGSETHVESSTCATCLARVLFWARVDHFVAFTEYFEYHQAAHEENNMSDEEEVSDADDYADDASDKGSDSDSDNTSTPLATLPVDDPAISTSSPDVQDDDQVIDATQPPATEDAQVREATQPPAPEDTDVPVASLPDAKDTAQPASPAAQAPPATPLPDAQGTDATPSAPLRA